MFTTDHHRTLFGVKLIQLTSLHLISLRSVLILFSPLRLGIPSDLFPSGFHTEICMNFFPMNAACSAQLILDLIILLCGESKKYGILHYGISVASRHFSPPRSEYSSQQPILKHLQPVIFTYAKRHSVAPYAIFRNILVLPRYAVQFTAQSSAGGRCFVGCCTLTITHVLGSM